MDKKIQNKYSHTLRQERIVLLILLLTTLTVSAGRKIKLTILHTNDTHSQVEPTEKSDLKSANMGGYARRMGVVQKIRSDSQNVLLLDAGDFSQGTPYFNFYNGRIEIDAMNQLKYDAGTLGNHEFDNGTDTLSVILKKAQFPIVSSNYNTTNSTLNGLTKPYIILKKSGLRIGIMALNINPKGLIIESNYQGVIYEEPIEKAIEISALLKKKEKCDVIICLSHLGTDSTKSAVTDFQIARKTFDIDVIIGGHSHSMITDTKITNAAGRPVIVAQMAKSGFYLGKIELDLEKK